MSMGTNVMNRNQYEPNEMSFQRGSHTSYSRDHNIGDCEKSINVSANAAPTGSNVSAVDEQKHRFASLGAGVAGWISEHLLLHPFVVIRRQCQVNHASYWSHLTPVTLITPMFNLQRQQNIGCLWKGVVSTLVVKAIGYATESAISEITPLPKEVSRHSPFKKIMQHLLLKGVSFIVVTPFYAASLVETVQAIEKDIEHPGLLDWLREGVSRIFSLQSPSGTRQLMLWRLILPTVLFGVGHYIISSMAQYNVALMLKKDIADKKEITLDADRTDVNTVYETYYPELYASFVGHLTADAMLFPLETVLHRLYIQGTRTIIDNMDTGLDVIPTNTSYEGPIDCVSTILRDEGVGGFYKGFGALILQYGVHQVILKATQFILERISLASDKGEPILGSDFSRLQKSELESDAVREPRLEPRSEYSRMQSANSEYPRYSDYDQDQSMYDQDLSMHGRQNYASNYDSLDQPSFGVDPYYSTSTPYMDTPTSHYRPFTGTGSAMN